MLLDVTAATQNKFICHLQMECSGINVLIFSLTKSEIVGHGACSIMTDQKVCTTFGMCDGRAGNVSKDPTNNVDQIMNGIMLYQGPYCFALYHQLKHRKKHQQHHPP